MENLKRDTDVANLYDDEVKEWIWEILTLIYHPNIFEDKIAQVDITNYRGVLPADVYEIKPGGIRDESTFIVFRESSYSFHIADDTNNSSPMEYTHGASVGYINTTEDQSLETKYVSDFNKVYYDMDYTYYIKDNYIYMRMTDLTLEVAYKAFPIWADYTPKIPNETKIIRAVQNYIDWKISFLMYRKGQMNKQIFDTIVQEKDWAIAAASNRMKMPSADKMESIKNRMLSMIPKNNLHDSSFQNYGTYQGLKGDNSR